MDTIEAIQDPVARHPLIGVLPSLGRYAGDLHDAAKVHLQPLVVVVVARLPASHVAAEFTAVEAGEPGDGEAVVHRRRFESGVFDAANKGVHDITNCDKAKGE